MVEENKTQVLSKINEIKNDIVAYNVHQNFHANLSTKTT